VGAEKNLSGSSPGHLIAYSLLKLQGRETKRKLYHSLRYKPGTAAMQARNVAISAGHLCTKNAILKAV
jgi:hypothetical protein